MSLCHAERSRGIVYDSKKHPSTALRVTSLPHTEEELADSKTDPPYKTFPLECNNIHLSLSAVNGLPDRAGSKTDPPYKTPSGYGWKKARSRIYLRS